MKKNRKLWALLSIFLMAALVLGACGTQTEEPTEEEPFKAGMVTDVGGVDDKSFNAASWEGLQRAEENLEDFEAQVLESQQQTDYATNIQQLLDQDTDLIVTVGFLLGEDTQTFAADNPESLFAIVDFAYEDPTDNLKGITFSTDEAAFLAGYVAAGMTETGKVGMFGGLEIPTVTIFMDGFAAGVEYYNAQKGTDVEALGRNLFVGNFESTEDGRNTGQTLIDEGADIIMPVAGPVGLGTAAVAQENEGVKVVWVDTDGCVSAPEYCDVFLTSVMKNMSNAVLDVSEKAYNGETEDWSVPYDGTLENGGVGIAPFNEFEDAVPDELKNEVEDIKQMIIDGELTTTGEAVAPEPEEEEEAAEGTFYERAMAGEFEGTVVTMTGPFVDADAVKFNNSVAKFEEDTGIDIQYEGSKEFEASISVRVEAGDPPDIVDFPQPGLLETFVNQGKVVDVSTFLPQESFDNYMQSWWDMATMESPDGEITAGVWHRFNAKSQVWYPVDDFEAAGYEVPETYDEMVALMDQIVDDGDKPWCVGIESGAATGWPATDWMEDIMLRTTSLENYDKWVDGELDFTSDEVRNALGVLDTLWADKYVFGGREALVTTNFADSPAPMFEDPPKCWLHRQGNFITSFFPEGATAGEDYDFFYFPPIDEEYGKPYLVAGDIMAMFNDRPEVRAVMEFFTKGEAVKEWI
ncbi:MAG: extracellular solute-binding protein, partial [Anaerolineales bacterium]|nr:extracellular solute-binding protein [Anaerolineales bacterium]